MDICAFAKSEYVFPDLQEEIIIEFGDLQSVIEEKIADVLDDSCPIVITGFSLISLFKIIFTFGTF